MLASVQEYNALNGVVFREDLQQLATDLQKDEQIHLANKLTNLLATNETINRFDIDIENQGFEEVPASLLGCLECITDPEEEFTGLNKAVSTDNIYQMVTDKIIARLKSNSEFNKSWRGGDKEGYSIAYNFDSKKPYTSVNQFMLGSYTDGQTGETVLLKNPYYLTFKQVVKAGGRILKGAKGQEVVYYTQLYKYEQDNPKLSFGTYNKERFLSWAKNNQSKITYFKEYIDFNGDKQNTTVDSFLYAHTLPILKYYNVFSGADVTGIDFDLENFKGFGFIEKTGKTNEYFPNADAIINNYPLKAPNLVFGGDIASYNRTKDTVSMPKIKFFDNSQAYYTTMFHEYIHSTGSEARLNRVKGKEFGDAEYSFEELIAEIGASYLSAYAGILHYTLRNGAAYIQGWRSRLIELMEKDNRFIFKASTKAQKAADFILQPDENGVPKYLKGLEKDQKKPIKKEKTPKPSVKPTKRKPKKKPKTTKSTVNPKAKKTKSKSNLPPVKVDEKGQTALFGAAKQPALNFEVIETPIVNESINNVIPSASPGPILETPVEVKKVVKPIKKAKGIISTDELMSMEFETLPFTGEWANFLESPAKNMQLAIWGKPKNGKTSSACQLANYLTNFGNVLYNFADQGINASTKKIWKLAGLDNNNKASLSSARDLKELEDICKTGQFDFVFIDMINTYIDRTKMKPHEFQDRFMKAFPDISFILVFEVTKSGNFKGDQGWTHLPDVLVTVENYVMNATGRYGIGHYVGWKEGLQKADPKKYAELYPDGHEPTANQQQPIALKYEIVG